MDFRKTYFVLPNLFTLSSVFCGFYAISLCARLGEEGPDEDFLYKAALAIIVGFFFDASDGRIARLTKTQSELGLQLDSLADAITFGVAPALLVYRWGLEDLGRGGLFVAFLFVAAGALRLARFNVLAMREKEAHSTPGKYMLGLPIPISSMALVGMVLAGRAAGIDRAVNQTTIAILVVVLAYLMISRVRFRSMKDVRPTRRTIGFVALSAILVVLLAGRISGPTTFMGLVGVYIVLGLLEEVVFFRRRRAEQSTAMDDEGEVLEELGANEPETGGGQRA